MICIFMYCYLFLISSANKRINERKRKQVWGDANVTSINDSNRMFNQKLEKSLGKYTASIKAALERGSA